MRAVEIMLVVPKSADDMMNVGRLNGFPGKLTAQGKLIKQGILLFCDITPLLANLDQAKAVEILAQFETKHAKTKATPQGSTATTPPTTSSPSPSSLSSLSSLSSQRDLLSASSIGTSQMSDQARIVLNHLLQSNQVKLRERQTFLFEQTIIFSEVMRKSGSSSSGSGQNSSSGGHSSNFQAPNSNYHPCYPHSHNAQGAIESCCAQSDCSLPQTGTNYCDRLIDGNPACLEGPCTTNLGSSINGPSDQQHSDGSQLRPSLIERLHSSSFSSSNPMSVGRRDSNNSASTMLALSGNNTHHAPPNHHHHLISAGSHYQSASSCIPPYYSMPSYEYKNHLSINKIALIDKHYGPSWGHKQLYQLLAESLDCDLESRRFMLKSRDPNQDNVIYLLQTGCHLDRDDWVCSIRSMLECQLDFLRALQSPIAYQRGLTKEG